MARRTANGRLPHRGEAWAPAPASSPPSTDTPLSPGTLVTNPKAPCNPHQDMAAQVQTLLWHQAPSLYFFHRFNPKAVLKYLKR